MEPKTLRILIVEDTHERQEILRNLFRNHAWILVHTADRAIRLLNAYDFDLISLDFDLAGTKRGDEVAWVIPHSRNSKTKVIIHSMNSPGAERIMALLPHANHVPISKMIKNNRIFKKLRQELLKGVDIDRAFFFRRERSSNQQK